MIWIVNPYDPLPGDPEQAGRYATLAHMLRDAGHDVVWWTSSYSHRFKNPVNQGAIRQACDAMGIGVRFIECPPYTKNISFARIRNHRAYARGFAAQALKESSPNVIIASNPPLESPVAAAEYAKSCGAKLIIDVQDIWVEQFRQKLPALIRWAWPMILAPYIRANRKAYRAADAVVGVAGGYADQPKLYGRHDYRREVIPLGIDLELFDEAAAKGKSLIGDKRANEIWSIYSGSFSRSYDVLTVARVAKQIVQEREDVRFIFTGRGELSDEARSIIGDSPRVEFLGFVPFEDWAATVRLCDIGWNAIKPAAMILFPNKIFYYWASGLAVMNTIPGECAELVEGQGTGLTYVQSDVEDACRVFRELIRDASELAARRQASRESAETRWGRPILYQHYIKLIDELM